MRKRFLAIGVAAVALTPTIASAQSQPRDGSQSQSSCERHRSNRVVATVAGAGVGGMLGNVIAGKGDKTIGTIIGAVGGAVVGNQIANPSNDCNHAYGYYDENNRWHATGVSAADGRGYYDRVGNWVDGPPTGRYGDDNRWIASPASTWGNDRYSAERGWVPASANGYPTDELSSVVALQIAHGLNHPSSCNSPVRRRQIAVKMTFLSRVSFVPNLLFAHCDLSRIDQQEATQHIDAFRERLADTGL